MTSATRSHRWVVCPFRMSRYCRQTTVEGLREPFHVGGFTKLLLRWNLREFCAQPCVHVPSEAHRVHARLLGILHGGRIEADAEKELAPLRDVALELVLEHPVTPHLPLERLDANGVGMEAVHDLLRKRDGELLGVLR